MSVIVTAQYVRIEQAVGSVGDRILAQLIDWGVLLAYMVMAGWVIAKLEINSFWFFILSLLFPVLFYTLAFELFNNGQTLGKMAMKLRVVKTDGSQPTLGALLLRWLLFLIDGPTFSFVGLIPMVLTRSNQRLGDLAAGTVVIKLQDYKRRRVSLDDYDYLEQDYTPRYPQAADLSLEQIELIRRVVGTGLNDRGEMTVDKEEKVLQLSRKVQQKLGISRTEPTDAAFLRRVVRDYLTLNVED